MDTWTHAGNDNTRRPKLASGKNLKVALNMPLRDGAVNDINTILSIPDTFSTDMKGLGKLQDVLSGNQILNINVSHWVRFRLNKKELI